MEIFAYVLFNQSQSTSLGRIQVNEHLTAQEFMISCLKTIDKGVENNIGFFAKYMKVFHFEQRTFLDLNKSLSEQSISQNDLLIVTGIFNKKELIQLGKSLVKDINGKSNHDQMLNSASDVWEFLKTDGGLDPTGYDRKIQDELRVRLLLPKRGKFESLLIKKKISSEDFIIAFFQTIQPFAEMMSDLLAMFEKAGAKQTDKNLNVHFNFDKEYEELKFDLSHFRDWLLTWHRISSFYLVNLWNGNTLWRLNKVLSKWNVRLKDSKMKSWCDQYFGGSNWPDFMPAAPITGNSSLDERLQRVWEVWTEVINESKKYGTKRKSLLEAVKKQQQRQLPQILVERSIEFWPPDLLWHLEADSWAGSLALGAYYKAEQISLLKGSSKRENTKELLESLDSVLDSVPQKEFESESLVSRLIEFLSLPIWKKRYELYSAWISTQIMETLNNTDIRIHHDRGRLSFSFAGSHLATADSFDPKLHVWAERRSPLLNPRGKSRKKAIQPDYSLVTDPVTSPDASILEIECKQYRKPSIKNFSDALSDYARGNQNALVVLVNYGNVTDGNVLAKVENSVRHRTFVIGDMKPGSVTAIKKFKSILYEAIIQRYGATNSILSEPKCLFLSANPPSPDAGEDYEVVARVLPHKSGLQITIKVTGTDGFKTEKKGLTDDTGQFRISVPGAREKVKDEIFCKTPDDSATTIIIFRKSRQS